MRSVPIRPRWGFSGVMVVAICTLLSLGLPSASAQTPLADAQAAAQKSLRDQTTISGLVVVTGLNGQMHGMAIDIIAVAPKNEENAPPRIEVIGKIGAEMRTSLDEAIRLVQLRDAKARQVHIQISFGDKYSTKDGGSAGTAFALLLLSALHHFELSPDVAITGDITVDGKIRQIGGVRAKVHGAALDHLRAVGMPLNNAGQLAEGTLLDGPSLLWDTQVIGLANLDDGIALVRKDRDPKLDEALNTFEKLRDTMAKRPVTDLATDAEAGKLLARVLELAPNHLSAATLQQLAAGKGPEHLSVGSSLGEAVAALGSLRPVLRMDYITMREADLADAQTLTTIRSEIAQLDKVVDPTAKDTLSAIGAYCDACQTLFDARKVMDARKLRAAMDLCRDKRAAIRNAITKVLDDKDMVDRIMRGE